MKSSTKSKKRPTVRTSRLQQLQLPILIIAVLVVVVAGVLLVVNSKAASNFAAAEPETGQIDSPAKVISDGTASNGSAISFGGGTITNPTPTPQPNPTPTPKPNPNPTPQPNPSPTPAPTGNPQYTLNYDSCDGSQWSKPSAVSGGLTAVTSPVHQGKCAMKVVVRPGDKPSSSGERAESLKDSTGMYGSGDHSFTAWSTMFPVGWSQIPDSGYQIFTQWHGVGDTLSPPVSYRISTKGLVLRTRGGSTDTNIKDTVITSSPSLGKWNDFVEETKWSGTSSGSITVWHRVEGGSWTKAISLTNIATTHGTSVYLRQGLYRSAFGSTNTLYHDGTVSGKSMADISRAFADGKTP